MYPMWKYAYGRRCGKKVRLTRCSACKGHGSTATTQCNRACDRKGYLCPTHGKDW